MISHQHKFIFVHIPKCGGTSVENFFGAWEDREEFCLGVSTRQHWTLEQIFNKYPDCKHYFKFTFVRNPFSRIVSEYFYIRWLKPRCVIAEISFKEFCLNLDDYLDKFANGAHHRTIADYLNEYPIDFIGRLESFQDDFNLVCDKIGIERQELPYTNKTKHKHYTEYYDDEIRDIVAKKYAKDIEYFGYKFGD